MEIDPLHQKTLPDFLLTEKMLGVKTVDIVDIKKDGARLYYERDGKRMPIRRIYNRAIVDELERKNVKLSFDWRDDLDVEWAGHPNWYFRISKFSIPYLKHASVPKTWFLDRLDEIPADLENYALKPLYSFAGLGVVIAPTKADIAAIPAEKRPYYILQERMQFEPRDCDSVWRDEGGGARDVYLAGRTDAGADDHPHGAGADDGRRSQQEYGVGGGIGSALCGVTTAEHPATLRELLPAGD